ncbi:MULTISPECIES: zinc ribbon domain-containing protein [Luteimonas]|uniref:zinc ribbon domain-containing protein n=1 Tax=Luteimonas TaxID=83614 RepID=UPI00117F62A4|nr:MULTISPECIES: zinc ribbon domain-containing protein [Luteimonas]
MKGFGQLLIGAGLVWVVFALQLDTSVPVPGMGRVQNFSLMEQRQTQLMLSGGTVLVGVLLFGFGAVRERYEEEGDERVCPHCAEPIRWEARLCKHCGKGVPNPVDEETGFDLDDLAPEAFEEPIDEHEAGRRYTYRELREAAEEGERAYEQAEKP